MRKDKQRRWLGLHLTSRLVSGSLLFSEVSYVCGGNLGELELFACEYFSLSMQGERERERERERDERKSYIET